MTARTKIHLLLASLLFANLAAFGAREILGALYDPVIRTLAGA